jgi:hypothetical protein
MGNKHGDILLGQFKADYHTLAHIKSRTRRTEAKRAILGTYQAWLDSYPNRTGQTSRDTNAYVWLLLWTIDAGQWARAVQLAQVAISHGMESPQDFSRSLAETICEEIAGGIIKAGNPADHADVLDALAALVESHDMADQVSAKLHKARALAKVGTDQDQARALFTQALTLDSGSGVKRYLAALDGANRKPTVKKPVLDISSYTLSGRAAAALANMTPPRFLRCAKRHPDLLPRIAIPMGTRTIYRFNPDNVRAFIKENHVSS